MGTLTSTPIALPGGKPEEYRQILARVGWVLIAAECLNLAYQLVPVLQGGKFTFGAEVLFLVAGVFLIQGSLPAARAVRWVAAFLIALESALLVAVLFWAPPDFVGILLRLHPRFVLEPSAWVLFGLLVNLWVYGQLSKEPVREHLQTSGSASWPGWSWLAGLLAGALLIGSVSSLLHGEASQSALSKAREQNGPGYRYFVLALSTNSQDDRRRVDSTVVGYNDHDIQMFNIKWEE